MTRRNFLASLSASAAASRGQRLFNPQGFNGTAQGMSWRGVTPQKAPQPDIFADFLVTARKRFQVAAEAEEPIRRDALTDLKFFSGDQWPDHVREVRDRAKRPCLTINRLPQIIQQITNVQRQSRPSIQVNPVGDRADVTTAQILQGILRHTEVNSMADIAYDTAFEYAAIMGFGYWRIRCDYIDDNSMDQDIFDEWIEDPFSVYLDPTARLADRSDMTYCFIVKDYTPDQFADEFPDAQQVGIEDFRSIGDGERWSINGKIRVAEYFWIEDKPKQLVSLIGGQVIERSQLRDWHEIAVRDGKPIMRTARKPEVWYCKMNALEELEKRRRLPGKWIPIIPVYGRELIVDGQRHLIGIVRDAIDSQRMYNYNRSKVTEAIALAPMAPWLVAEGQDEGYTEEFKMANTDPLAIIHYRTVDVFGRPVPPPQRIVAEPAIQAMAVALSQADNDLKAVTGIYDASLGQRGPEESGKAILARQHQGEVANSNLPDNFGRSLRHAGRVKLAIIPEIFDVPKIQRIVWPDETHEMVQLNQPFMEEGMQKLFDVRVGTYDITISVGSSYQSRRQEFVNSVLSLVQAAPQTMSLVLDLLVRNMDWPGAQEIADRLNSMLPQHLQNTANKDQQQIPPQFKAQLALLMQQNATLIQALNKSTDMMKTKQLEHASKERMNALDNLSRIIAAIAKGDADAARTLAQLDFRSVEHRLDLLNVGQPIEGSSPAQPGTQPAGVAPVGQPAGPAAPGAQPLAG